MSALSPKVKVNLAAAFMSLALAQPAEAVPLWSKGHVDWLPVYGPVEDKTCAGKIYGNKKPGDWQRMVEQTEQVVVVGNDCKNRFMRIDPATLQITEFSSPSEALRSPPATVLNASPAPARWWEKPNLLPAKPQGEVQVSGPPAGGPRMCTVRIEATQVIQAAPGVLIIPDATRAFYLTTHHDPSIQKERISANESVDYGKDGKQVCTLDPLIILPSAPDAMTMAGGGLRTPGRITPPAKPAVPATAVPVVVGAAEGLAAGIALLNLYYLQHKEALTASGAIIYNSGADLLVATKEAMGVSAEQLGQMATEAQNLPAPTMPEVEAGIARNDPAGATPLAESLRRPGNCGQNDYDRYFREKQAACPRDAKNACDNVTDPVEALSRAKIFAFCAMKREQLDQKCFDGGDSGHRTQTRDFWRGAKKCLSKVL